MLPVLLKAHTVHHLKKLSWPGSKESRNNSFFTPSTQKLLNDCYYQEPS